MIVCERSGAAILVSRFPGQRPRQGNPVETGAKSETILSALKARVIPLEFNRGGLANGPLAIEQNRFSGDYREGLLVD